MALLSLIFFGISLSSCNSTDEHYLMFAGFICGPRRTNSKGS